MDGKLPSLFIRNRDDNTYSLTHVEHTPLKKSCSIEEITNYYPSIEEVCENRNKMENEILKYIPDFCEIFSYNSYYSDVQQMLDKIFIANYKAFLVNHYPYFAVLWKMMA